MTDDPSAESFHGLMLRLRGRTGLTQRQLAAKIGVAVRSIQAWESGLSYPTAASLELLIAAYLDAHGFATGREAVEAEAFWDAAVFHSPRLRPPFEHRWFTNLLAGRAGSAAGTGSPRSADARGPERASPSELTPRQEWGDAPDVPGFVGRAEELAAVRAWVLQDHCHLVGILGMGGIGKTSIATKVAKDVAPAFQRAYWRGLRNAPPASEWQADAIRFLLASRSCHRTANPSGSQH